MQYWCPTRPSTTLLQNFIFLKINVGYSLFVYCLNKYFVCVCSRPQSWHTLPNGAGSLSRPTRLGGGAQGLYLSPAPRSRVSPPPAALRCPHIPDLSLGQEERVEGTFPQRPLEITTPPGVCLPDCSVHTACGSLQPGTELSNHSNMRASSHHVISRLVCVCVYEVHRAYGLLQQKMFSLYFLSQFHITVTCLCLCTSAQY